MCVVPDRGPLCRRGTVLVWSADAGGSPSDDDRSAEHAAVADAAARPRDRAVFEGWNRTSVVPVY
jgi:hypothetical protein